MTLHLNDQGTAFDSSIFISVFNRKMILSNLKWYGVWKVHSKLIFKNEKRWVLEAFDAYHLWTCLKLNEYMHIQKQFLIKILCNFTTVKGVFQSSLCITRTLTSGQFHLVFGLGRGLNQRPRTTKARLWFVCLHYYLDSFHEPVILLTGLQLRRQLVQLLLPLCDDLVEVLGTFLQLDRLVPGTVNLRQNNCVLWKQTVLWND